VTVTTDTPRGLIGVIHLRPLPGDPLHDGSGFSEVERAALDDAEALVRGGADGLILENFGSAPFPKLRVPPHHVATLAILARECARRFPTAVGVNCLRNDARAAIAIAASAGASFVRVNVHVGVYATDQGLIEGDAYRTLRYRAALGASPPSVHILADVLVKHAAPITPIDPHRATEDALDRGLADAVIVTGDATGAPIARATLEAVRAAARDRPVYLGSGVTPESARELGPLADGAIVGTWLKQGGDVRNPIDPARVAELAAVLRDTLRTTSQRSR